MCEAVAECSTCASRDPKFEAYCCWRTTFSQRRVAEDPIHVVNDSVKPWAAAGVKGITGGRGQQQPSRKTKGQFYSQIQQVCKFPNQTQNTTKIPCIVFDVAIKRRKFYETLQESSLNLVLSRNNGPLWRRQFGWGAYNDPVLDCRSGPKYSITGKKISRLTEGAGQTSEAHCTQSFHFLRWSFYLEYICYCLVWL